MRSFYEVVIEQSSLWKSQKGDGKDRLTSDKGKQTKMTKMEKLFEKKSARGKNLLAKRFLQQNVTNHMSFFRRMVSLSLTELLRKGKSFKWTDTEQCSYDRLKSLI